MYIGNAFASQYVNIEGLLKIVVIVFLWIFSIIMIYKYAPADTEDIPVISKKERKKRKYFSYAIATIMLITVYFVNLNIISNMIIIGVALQTFSITRVAYKLTNNKYGHEEYWKNKNVVIN